MADLNGTIVRGNLRVTDDTNINGSLTVTGASVAFPSAIKISGITSNGALYYNSAGTVSISAIPAAQVNADWTATTGKSSILNKPTIPAAQVNADWNATTGVASILNKPTIPAAQVNADWNATTGKSSILNKPTIPTVPNEYGKISDGTTTTTANAQQDTITFAKGGDLTVAVSGDTVTYSYTHPTTTAVTASLYKVGKDTKGHVVIGDAFTIPAAQVNADWNATTGKSSILNKPAVIIGNASNNYSWFDVKSASGKYTYAVGASVYAVSTVVSSPYLKVYQSESNVGYYETHYGTDTIAFTGSVTGGTSFTWTYAFPEKSGTFAMTTDIPTNFPPKDHASTATTYGSATDTKYGHVKLVSGNVSGTTYAAGVAAAASHNHNGVYATSDTWIANAVNVAGYVAAPTAAANKNSVWKTDANGAPAWRADVGFANPMTTAGDLIYGGTNGAATRLAKGTNGSVLKMVNGSPAWAADTDYDTWRPIYVNGVEQYTETDGLGVNFLDDGDDDGTDGFIPVYFSYFNNPSGTGISACASLTSLAVTEVLGYTPASAGHNHDGVYLKTQYTSTFSVYGGTTCAVTFNQSANRSITFSAGAGITISASAVNSNSGKITISAPLYAHYCAWIYSASEFKFDINFTLYLSTSAPTNPISVSGYLAYASNPMMVTPANGVVTIDACSVYGYKSIFCNVTGIGISSSALFFRMFSIYTLSGSIATFNFTNSPYLPSVFPTYSDILTNCSWYDTVVAM